MLSGKGYNAVVFLFWLTTMSWLLAAKVIPPLVIGEPPTYRAIIAAEKKAGDDLPVAWKILADDEEIGWAATMTRIRKDELTEIRNRVHFAKLPLERFIPVQLGGFLSGPGGQAISLDATSTVAIDPLGRLNSFWSRVGLAGIADLIRVQGVVEGSSLVLSVRTGNFVQQSRVGMSVDALVGDALAPQSRLPELRIGQTWTVPVFSPFRPPNSPVQILKAQVTRDEYLVWNNRGVMCWVVEYRGDDGAGLTSKEAQGRVWVRKDGTVLQQEVMLLNTQLRFVRLDPLQGGELLNEVSSQFERQEQLWESAPSMPARNPISPPIH